jgi:hypothetical protein
VVDASAVVVVETSVALGAFVAAIASIVVGASVIAAAGSVTDVSPHAVNNTRTAAMGNILLGTIGHLPCRPPISSANGYVSGPDVHSPNTEKPR